MGHTDENQSRSLQSTSDPLVIEEPAQLELNEQTFLNRLVEFISTIKGINKEKLKIQSNNRFPSKNIYIIKNLPTISMEDLGHIEMLHTNLKSINIFVQQKTIKIEIWKETNRKRKHDDDNDLEIQTTGSWNLKEVSKEDKKIIENVLNGFSNMSTIECQFHADIISEPPNYYYIHIIPRDNINYKETKQLIYKFRSFIKTLTFNFEQNTIIIKIRRLRATMALEYKNKRVFKKLKSI